MRIALTAPAINKAVATAARSKARIELADKSCPGLWLRVTPSGTQSWVLVCRDRAGKSRRWPLGAYPALGVADAREAARTARVKVRHENVDTISAARREREVARNAREGVGTLAALIEDYAAHKAKAKKSKTKAWPESKRRIEVVFADHLQQPAENLTREGLQRTANRWPSGQSAAAAVRYIRPILRWASDENRVPADTANVKPPQVVGRRDRVLSREELGRVLPVLRASDSPYAAATQMMLLTLARREEVGQARWQDIDMDAGQWVLPDTKNGKPHVLGLSRQAVALLRDRMPRDKHDQPVTPDRASLVFSNAAGRPLDNWHRYWLTLMEASATEGFHRHDLRRTGATMLHEMGVQPIVVEAALNHAVLHSDLSSRYNQYRYGREVAVALQALADEFDAIARAASEQIAAAA